MFQVNNKSIRFTPFTGAGLMCFNNKFSNVFSFTWRQAKFNNWIQQAWFGTRTILDWFSKNCSN